MPLELEQNPPTPTEQTSPDSLAAVAQEVRALHLKVDALSKVHPKRTVATAAIVAAVFAGMAQLISAAHGAPICPPVVQSGK